MDVFYACFNKLTNGKFNLCFSGKFAVHVRHILFLMMDGYLNIQRVGESFSIDVYVVEFFILICFDRSNQLNQSMAFIYAR